MMRWAIVLGLSVGAAALGIACSGSESAQGRVGESCYGNGTCNPGLMCEGQVCVLEAAPAGCMPGERRTCACRDGTAATQVCSEEGMLGPCVCGGESAGGAAGQGGAPTAGAPPTGGAGDTGGASSGGGTSTPGGPEFLTFNTNTGVMRSDESLIFTAVLTDPDGVDDIIGGTLLDPDTGNSYGSFATSAAEASYTLTLTWDAINTVRPIEAEVQGSGRTFRAEFYDAAGNRATQTITVTLKCIGGEASCGAGCVSVAYDPDNCASCGRVCPSQDWTSNRLCDHYSCAWTTDLLVALEPCSNLCASLGLLCYDDAAASTPLFTGGHLAYYNDTISVAIWKELTCDEMPPQTYSGYYFNNMACTCSEPRPDWWNSP